MGGVRDTEEPMRESSKGLPAWGKDSRKTNSRRHQSGKEAKGTAQEESRHNTGKAHEKQEMRDYRGKRKQAAPSRNNRGREDVSQGGVKKPKHGWICETGEC